MATFIPSKYQQAVYNWIQTGNGNATVSAVAGSGKSTTIVNALDLIPATDSKIFLAFNKAIVDELKLKVKAPNTDIKTLHSAGFASMMFTYKSNIISNSICLVLFTRFAKFCPISLPFT